MVVAICRYRDAAARVSHGDRAMRNDDVAQWLLRVARWRRYLKFEMTFCRAIFICAA